MTLLLRPCHRKPIQLYFSFIRIKLDNFLGTCIKYRLFVVQYWIFINAVDEAQIKYHYVHQNMMILLEPSKSICSFQVKKIHKPQNCSTELINGKKHVFFIIRNPRETKNPYICICICIFIDAARNDWLQYIV